MPKLRDQQDEQAQQQDGFQRLDEWMADPKFQEHLRHLLPQQMNPLRFMTITQRIVREVPQLAECNPMDICLATLQAATLGLEISTNGECWIIPYKNKEGFPIPELQVGYLGHLALAYRSEKIAAVHADVVMPGDRFEYQGGTDGYVHHVPGSGERKIGPELTHVWSIVETTFGGKLWTVLSRADVERIRQSGKSGNSPAWRDWYPEMAMAKCLKRTLKWAPKSREASRAITLDDEADAGKAQSFRTEFPTLSAGTPPTPAQKLADDAREATEQREREKPEVHEPETAAEGQREPEPQAERKQGQPQATKVAAKPKTGKMGW